MHTRETADIVVVGGGVIGLSVARALALRGVKKVTLIERFQLGTEASFAAAGMLAPQAEADSPDDFFNLARESRDLYPAFAAALYHETGVDIELDQTGTLYLALTDHDEEEIQKRFQWQRNAGLPVEMLTNHEARQLEPAINENVCAALRFPLDIQVENRRLLRALVAANQALGVRFIIGETVEAVRIRSGVSEGVESSGGFVSCKAIVIAGGAWSSTIGGLPSLEIEPVRGQMVCFSALERLCRHVIYSPRGYIVPRTDGRLLAGSTSEHAGFERLVTAGGLFKILSRALEISPQIAKLAVTDTWAGLRPRAPDNLPVLGPDAEIDGLFYATGHYRNGILLAPITGELIAEAIMRNFDSSRFGAFSPGRFTSVAIT
ncbi:MAG TPA: glycine oxidase ThiO [Pyrinomonadaceae bacterium]|nr:glycine oxidase ThiO [Pyrinomonadaceae bacterium]